MIIIPQAMRKTGSALLWTAGALAAVCAAISFFVSIFARGYVADTEVGIRTNTAIILGAAVYGGETLSDTMRDRMDTAIELYDSGLINTLLISHSERNNTDMSINTMAKYAIQNDVPEEAIRLDAYGYNTRASMRNAKHTFQIQHALIVTQDYHLPRAVYLAHAYGIDAYGVSASKRYYIAEEYFTIREWFARVKDVILILLERLEWYRI